MKYSFIFGSLAQSCSHVGAVMFSISHYKKDSTAATSTLCKWKVPRPMNIKPIPLSQFNLSSSGASKQTKPKKQVKKLPFVSISSLKTI